MRVEVRSPGALSDSEIGRWRALAARAVEPNPFFEPEFVLPATRHLQDAAVALLVVDEGAGSEWSACMPVRRQARFRAVPGPALVTWLHPYAYLGTPLMAIGAVAPAWRALLEHPGGTGLLCLGHLGEDGPVASALLEALRAVGSHAFLYERFERAALVRRPDADYLNPALGSRRRRELRRQRRVLEEHLGLPLAVRERAGEPAAVDDFLQLEAAGWKGRDGTAMATAGHGELFGELARGFAGAGRLQLLSLEAGGRVLAMKCNLLAGDGIFCFRIAYDEALARFSPGVQLELENIGVFDATAGATWTDSCAAAHNQMINRLWRDRRSLATVLVPRGGATAAASRFVVRGALRVRRRLRSRE